jgi:hypothetical protein
MRAWRSLALLALVAALTVIVVLEPGKTPPPPQDRLSQLDPGMVQTITIRRPTGETLQLERQAAGWQLTHPFTAPADETRTTAIAALVGAPVFGRYPVANLDLATFGLAKPHLHLRVDGVDVQLGDREPLHHRRYARLADEVLVIPDHHFLAADTTALGLVSRRLLPVDAQPVVLRLPAWRLRLTETGAWTVDPTMEGIAPQAAAGLVEAWRNASAAAVTEAPADPADGEWVTIQLAGREQPLRFQARRGASDLMLVRHDLGIAYRLPGAMASALLDLAPDRPTPQGAR